MKPTLSIVCTTLNAEEHFESMLKSLQNQTCKDFELIILDGISSDRTLKIAEQYRTVITSVVSKKDRTALEAINREWSLVRGDLFMFIGADDWLERDAVEKIVDCYKANQDATIVGFGVEFFLDKGTESINQGVLHHPEGDVFSFEDAVYGGCISQAFHRNLFEKFGFYDVDMWWNNADRELQLRFSLSNPRKAVIPQILYHFRKHIGSTTASGIESVTSTCMERSMRMAEHHYEISSNNLLKSKLLMWLGFCSARACYSYLKQFRFKEFSRILIEVLINHPKALWYVLLSPKIPSEYKIK